MLLQLYIYGLWKDISLINDTIWWFPDDIMLQLSIANDKNIFICKNKSMYLVQKRVGSTQFTCTTTNAHTLGNDMLCCIYIYIHTYVHIILEPTFNNTIIKGAIIGTFFPAAAAGIVLHIIYIYGAIALLIIYLFCHLLCFPFDISCIIYKFWWARACWRFSKQLFL